MAKNAILNVLENTIGRYVLNLDAESLNVAVWSGKIDLRSLQLDTVAVNSELAQRALDAPNLASPFKVLDGKFEKVQLEVPWARLGSRPVIFRAQGLSVVVEPHDFLGDEDIIGSGVDKSREKNEKKASEERLDSILRAETARKTAEAVRIAWEEKEDYSMDDNALQKTASSDNNASFLSTLVRRIIENLQFEVKDVHIAIRGCGCAAGVVLDSLSLATTDAKGSRTFVDRHANPKDPETSFLYKELLIFGFGIYLQNASNDHESQKTAISATKKEYVLSPLSFQTRLRQSDLDQCIDFPKYLVHSKLPSLTIDVSRTQLELGQRLALAVSPSTNMRPLFPEYRPSAPVMKNPKHWWFYAVRCVGRLNRRRSWMEFYIAFQKRKAYVQLYKRHAYSETSPWLSKLSGVEHAELEKIERDRTISVSALMLWRTIADERVEMERKKHELAEKLKQRGAQPKKLSKRPSVKASLFGSGVQKGSEDEAPITLTVEEMKELEDLAFEKAYQPVSNDSMYCDIDFNLGSFQINLVNSSDRPFTSLEMGSVSTSFRANANGSLVFDVNLSSLEVLDNVTANTLYPKVCRSLQHTQPKQSHAFRFQLKKTKDGDQELIFNMVAFETVASPLLLIEIKDFFTFPEDSNVIGDVLTSKSDELQNAVSEQLSSALLDAWKGKNQKKQKWTMDFDISAPILIVPENCVNSDATCLIFNFGHFYFSYGKDTVPPAVQEWFDARTLDNEIDLGIDCLHAKLTDMSFAITSVGEASSIGIKELEVGASRSVIQPITLTLDVGLERLASSDNSIPRTCIVGVLPAIILHLSPSHITNMLLVAASWTSNLQKMMGDIPDAQIESSHDQRLSDSMRNSKTLSSTNISSQKRMKGQEQETTNAVETMNISLSLLRLSLNVYTDDGTGLEMHLVSVVASSSLSSDGSSTSRLCMGWFWLLDQLELNPEMPRRQRLICHSNLPRPADSYAENNRYSAIMKDLENEGVFEPNYAGSSDLADIHILNLPGNKAFEYHNRIITEFSSEYMKNVKEVDGASVINAKFSSLFINWNPHAISALIIAQKRFMDFKYDALSTYEQISTLQELDHLLEVKTSCSEDDATDSESYLGIHSAFLIGQINSLEISFNSGTDDIPLFNLTMSGTKITHHTTEEDEESSAVSLVIGDVCVKTPSNGPTLEQYQTLIGLSPCASSSLLSVTYYNGVNIVRSLNVSNADISKCEAYTEVALSQMRFVHIHSQLFTLIDYISEDVCGAFDVDMSSVASMAAAAAKEAAKSSDNGERLFCVVASGLDFVLPQAAYSDKHFLFNVGSLKAHYRSLENDAGSEARASLSDLTMSCDTEMRMMPIPVGLSIAFDTKTSAAEKVDTSVDIDTSGVKISLARCHYAQIMHTLEYNIGEQNNFLRREQQCTSYKKKEQASPKPPDSEHSEPGKGDNSGDDNQIHLKFKLHELTLELCGNTTDEPIISLSAVKALISLDILPDEKLTKSCVKLHDLVCDDRRVDSMNVAFRRMIGRVKDSDAFSLDYTKHDDNDSEEINVNVGSYQIVVLPDVISDMISFFAVEPFRAPLSSKESSAISDNEDGASTQVFVSEHNENAIEACVQPIPSLRKANYQVESSNVQLVLVDLGSSGSQPSTKASTTLTETIVLQGKMHANIELTTDIASSTTMEADYKIDAERIEIYTARGADLKYPVQILEPSKFAVFYYEKSGGNVDPQMTELKFATMSPIDITVSMQNMALASALSSSLSDALSGSDVESDLENGVEFLSLSAKDASRLEILDSLLEKENSLEKTNPSEHQSELSMRSDGRHIQNNGRNMKLRATLPDITLTMTNDFRGLDEALFKLSGKNCVAGGELTYLGLSEAEKPRFGFNLNLTVDANYFDTASNRWERLLATPWDLTLDGTRGPQSKLESKRLLTTFDFESSPCHVSFSERFLVSVGASMRMWSVYSGASTKAAAIGEGIKNESIKRRVSKSMAAHAARSLITTMPYAIENHSGINAYYSISDDPAKLPLPTSCTKFFRFVLFPEKGSGGMRRYGQDIKHLKSLTLYIGNTQISIDDVDSRMGKPREAHFLPEFSTHIFTSIVKSGDSTVLHLSSHIEVYNPSSLSFRVSLPGEDGVRDLGVIDKTDERFQTSLKEHEELMTHTVFGLPAPLLEKFSGDKSSVLSVQFSPLVGDTAESDRLVGACNLPSYECLVETAKSNEHWVMLEVTCTSDSRDSKNPPLTANVRCKVQLVDEKHPFVQLFIEPRAVIVNNLPLGILLRTPMPHTILKQSKAAQIDHPHQDYSTHNLSTCGSIEVFTPGPSIGISMKCADVPVGGTATGWIEGEWLVIPLGKYERISEPKKCVLPFEGGNGGSEIFVLEADDVTPDLVVTDGQRSEKKSSRNECTRTISIIVCAYSLDHTCNVLFESVSTKGESHQRQKAKLSSGSPPYSAFASVNRRRWISLLPSSSGLIRILQWSTDGEEGWIRSAPFRVEDVSMTYGINATPILWAAGNKPSGYFAYRRLKDEGSELHIIPEYVIFNGSQHHSVRVKQASFTPFLLKPLKISPISRDTKNQIVVQFEVTEINGLTTPVQIDKVGLRICIVKSKLNGEPLGSLAVQTITGTGDSRLVIKIGAANFGDTQPLQSSGGIFEHDFIRFHAHWSEMSVMFKDTDTKECNDKQDENRAAIRKYLEHHNVDSDGVEERVEKSRTSDDAQISFPEVAKVSLSRFTVDFQRMFKDEDDTQDDTSSNERCQLLVEINKIRIIDCSPDIANPTVFDSMSDKSFFDLCIRTRGPLHADLIRVDLFDLNLAYGEGKAEKIVINTGEEFVWRTLDVVNRIMVATAELAGVDLDLKWDESTEKFVVILTDAGSGDLDSDDSYRPPMSDRLLDVRQMRVSPFTVVVSFKRKPQSSRYKLTRGVYGARLANYFTTHLKFTIDRAELRFQGYMARDMKGPPDRFLETLKTVYMSQLKSKVVPLLAATSFQDWKLLAGRESGGEEYAQGDFLRMIGNIAGTIGGAVIGKPDGDGKKKSKPQVQATWNVGSGVNNLLSGVGEGVGNSVKGVGAGVGASLRVAEKGFGQAVEGVGSGVQTIAKSITGDQDESTSIEVTEDGSISDDKGSFSGPKGIGGFIGGMFGGKRG